MQYMDNVSLQCIKFIYSEKATKFCEIFPLLLTTVHTLKCKVEISQNFAAFSEYMNFTNQKKSAATQSMNKTYLSLLIYLDQDRKCGPT